jgi:hypothetical protein
LSLTTAIRIVDTTELSEEKRRQRYIREAAVTGAFTSHAVRGIFGSRHYPGTKFGVSVPALRIEGAMRDDPRRGDRGGQQSGLKTELGGGAGWIRTLVYGPSPGRKPLDRLR